MFLLIFFFSNPASIKKSKGLFYYYYELFILNIGISLKDFNLFFASRLNSKSNKYLLKTSIKVYAKKNLLYSI